MKKTISLLLTAIMLLGTLQVSAQTATSLSLEQSIAYALANRANIKIAQNQQKIDAAQVGEIRSMGLPQINVAAEVGNNFIQQKTLVDPSAFGGPTLDPFVITPEQLNSGQPITLRPNYSQPEPQAGGGLVAITFVQPYTGGATVTGSQLLFDGSYLIGLKAAKTYTELSSKSLKQTEIDVAEQVAKAYYSVLVSRARMELLNQNLSRLDTLLFQTSAMFQNGVAEKLDVDRLRVSLNNLKVEKQKTDRLLQLGVELLKFQMGMDQKEQVILTDDLAEVEVDISKTNTRDFNYSSRIEYSILETQRDLANLDLRNIRAGFYPKLYLNARYGYLGVGATLSDVLRVRGGHNNMTDRNYFDFGFVGVQLQMPIFDGLRKRYQVKQAQLRLENTKLGFETLGQSIDLQLTQSSTDLTNSMDVLNSQRENMELAEEIARVAKIKFQEGVGTNLEVVTAETELRQAQTNYYSAMYDALIAKVNLDKATGTLLNK